MVGVRDGRCCEQSYNLMTDGRIVNANMSRYLVSVTAMCPRSRRGPGRYLPRRTTIARPARREGAGELVIVGVPRLAIANAGQPTSSGPNLLPHHAWRTPSIGRAWP